jgi:hypothetical protein
VLHESHPQSDMKLERGPRAWMRRNQNSNRPALSISMDICLMVAIISEGTTIFPIISCVHSIKFHSQESVSTRHFARAHFPVSRVTVGRLAHVQERQLNGWAKRPLPPATARAFDAARPGRCNPITVGCKPITAGYKPIIRGCKPITGRCSRDSSAIEKMRATNHHSSGRRECFGDLH